jgi:hypothetical protein
MSVRKGMQWDPQQIPMTLMEPAMDAGQPPSPPPVVIVVVTHGQDAPVPARH